MRSARKSEFRSQKSEGRAFRFQISDFRMRSTPPRLCVNPLTSTPPRPGLSLLMIDVFLHEAQGYGTTFLEMMWAGLSKCWREFNLGDGRSSTSVDKYCCPRSYLSWGCTDRPTQKRRSRPSIQRDQLTHLLKA